MSSSLWIGTISTTRRSETSPLLAGLLAYWNLNDNGSGAVSLVDSSGNGRTLTNENDVNLGTGIIAGGGVFGGIFPSYFEWLTRSPFPAFGTGDFTLSVWINKDEVTTDYYQTFISTRPDGAATGNSFSMGFSPDSVPIYYDGVGTFTGDAISNLQWYHFAVKNTNNLISVYINGIFQISAGQYGSYTNSYLSIGGNQNGDEPFGGKIDEVGIWNRSLSDNEILALYNAGSGLSYPFAN
jgi:hypothetical protein